MDQVLQGSNMLSAKARKQRIQERQKQADLLREQRQERKNRMMRYSETYSSSAEDDSSRSSSPENDSTAETPSEYSARTPDNLSSPEIEVKSQPQTQSHESGTGKGSHHSPPKSPPKLSTVKERSVSKRRLGASLAKRSDFSYDRFSIFVGEEDFTDDESALHEPEPVPVPEPKLQLQARSQPESTPQPTVEEIDWHESSDGDSDSDEDEIEVFEVNNSPIETAKSVSYSMPRAKPLMISVVTAKPAPPEEHDRINSSSTTKSFEFPAPPPLRIQKSVDGFLASEAKPVQFPSPPLHDRTSSAPVLATLSSVSKQGETDLSLRKKSSMSVLGRFAHARAHSIKNFIKPTSETSAPDMPQLPSAHQSRPSTANIELMAKSSPASALPPHVLQEKSPNPRLSLTEPTQPIATNLTARPHTSHSKQRSIPLFPKDHEVPKPLQPLVVPEPSAKMQEPENSDQASLARKKSFSNLRRRSGSIGQALKFATNKGKPITSDSPLPPMPNIIPVKKEEPLPPRQSNISPVPKTPKSGKGIGYSPFPRTSKIGEPVGLGLKLT